MNCDSFNIILLVQSDALWVAYDYCSIEHYLAFPRFIMKCSVLIWNDWYFWLFVEFVAVKGVCKWERIYLMWHGSVWVILSTMVGNFGVFGCCSNDKCCLLMHNGCLVYVYLDIVENKGCLELDVGCWYFGPSTASWSGLYCLFCWASLELRRQFLFMVLNLEWCWKIMVIRRRLFSLICHLLCNKSRYCRALLFLVMFPKHVLGMSFELAYVGLSI